MKTLKIGALALGFLAIGSAFAMDDLVEQVNSVRTTILNQKGHVLSKTQYAFISTDVPAMVAQVIVRNDKKALSDAIEFLNEYSNELDALHPTRLDEIQDALSTSLLRINVVKPSVQKSLIATLITTHPKKFIALGTITALAAVYGIYKLVTAKPKTKSVDIEETDIDEQELELM